MKPKLLYPVCLLALVLSASNVQAHEETKSLDEEVQDAIELFKKSDPTIEGFFKKSAGYAVFPSVAKGAIGVGAAKGKGLLYEKGKAIGETSLTQVTIGLQLGGQVYAEVIFFENEEALKGFKEGKFEMSAQASAVAAAEGTSKNAKYEHGVLIFTMAKTGLMYEASVGGQKFKFKPYDK